MSSNTTEIEKSAMGALHTREDLEQFIKLLYFTEMGTDLTDEVAWGVPGLILSLPGMAKTSLMRAWMKQLRYGDQPAGYLATEPGAIGEAGLGVTPVPVQLGENKSELELVFPPSSPFRRLSDFSGGMCFLDEITTARGVQLDAFLTLLQVGKIGDFYMNPAIRRMAAGNPSAMTGGDEIPGAVANRLCWVQWNGTHLNNLISYWKGRRLENEEVIQADKLEELVHTQFPEVWPDSVALWAGFLSTNPGQRQDMPNTHRAAGPWPSDRSHTTAMRILTAGKILKIPQPIIDVAIKGCIGQAAFSSLIQYKVQADLPDIGQLLEGKCTFTHSYGRIDRTAAVVEGMDTLFTSLPVSRYEQAQSWVQNITPLLIKIAQSAPDVLRPLITTIANYGVEGGKRSMPSLLIHQDQKELREVYGQVAMRLSK